jgi:hypothetical protein
MNTRPFHNAPSLLSLNPPPAPAGLAGTARLFKLEDDYCEYRKSCNLGYCKSEASVHADFKAKIAAATSTN